MNTHTECDFNGLDDPIDLFASPRMYPIMALYVANRLKWDLYRRYCVSDNPSDPTYLDGNETIVPERGQSLNVNEGVIITLQNLYNKDEGTQNDILNEIVKETIKQILDTNFINMVANSRGWV